MTFKNIDEQIRKVLLNSFEDYNDFANVVDGYIARAIRSLQDGRKHFSEADEDTITHVIIQNLSALPWKASHDTNTGGHVDILIEFDEYRWHGEAKVFRSDYQKLLGGISQLMNRYTIGTANESNGGFLIYFFTSNVKKFMDKWMKEFLEAHPSARVLETPRWQGLGFDSIIQHQSSGLDITIRHYPVLLLFKPSEGSDNTTNELVINDGSETFT